MSVSIEEKDGCLIVSSVPAAGKNYCLLPLSNPRTARTDNRKSFLCRCLKNEKTPSWAVTRRRFFSVFALLGVGHPRWGDFEKSALKSPETRMNTEKNRGDIYFVTPSWEVVTKLLSAGLILFEGIFSTKDQKEHSTKWESPVQNRYILLFLQPVFLFLLFWPPIAIKINLKNGLSAGF